MSEKQPYKACPFSLHSPHYFLACATKTNMADNDDFEIIGDIDLSSDQTYDLVDIHDHVEEMSVISPPRTPDFDLPLPSPPVFDSVLPVLVQQPIPVRPTIVSSPVEERQILFKASSPSTPISPLRNLVPAPVSTPVEPRTFAPVPPLPKAPAPRRYGDAATIPHNSNETVDINVVIEKSRRQQQSALKASLGNPQKEDIRTVLEQRRLLLLNNKVTHSWTNTSNCLHRSTTWSNQNRYLLLFLFFRFSSFLLLCVSWIYYVHSLIIPSHHHCLDATCTSLVWLDIEQQYASRINILIYTSSLVAKKAEREREKTTHLFAFLLHTPYRLSHCAREKKRSDWFLIARSLVRLSSCLSIIKKEGGNSAIFLFWSQYRLIVSRRTRRIRTQQ